MAHLKRRFLPAWLFSAPITSTFLLNRHSHPYAHQQYLYVKYASVTRLGDLLHFGQLFKACGINYFAQIALNLGNFCKVVKIFQLAWEIIFGQLSWTFGDFYLVTLGVRKEKDVCSQMFQILEIYLTINVSGKYKESFRPSKKI